MNQNDIKYLIKVIMDFKENNSLSSDVVRILDEEIQSVMDILAGKSGVKVFCRKCAELQIHLESADSNLDLFFQFTRTAGITVDACWWFEGAEDKIEFHQLNGDFLSGGFLFLFIGNIIEELIEAGFEVFFIMTTQITSEKFIRRNPNYDDINRAW